jgi:hypothetical protein
MPFNRIADERTANPSADDTKLWRFDLANRQNGLDRNAIRGKLGPIGHSSAMGRKVGATIPD